jgi:hypothetical protein
VDAHPSPPAFARLRRGMQSSPLQQGARRDKPHDMVKLQNTTRDQGSRRKTEV